ncbi:MAG: DUF721 domain-containing protein [Myxococcota bacterium]|nr:DUF721 domain-containing protein [Myxococcota bacterium]
MAGRGRRKSKPVAVSQTLVQILGDLGLDGAQRAFEVGEHWARAVGEEVAEHSRPIAMRGDVLEVAVDSSVWAQHLQLQLPRILKTLGELLPDGATPPTDVRFRVGLPSR